MTAIIGIEQLTKEFKIIRKDPGIKGAIKSLFRPKFERKLAVDHISFEVQTGEIVGYIGVNGAGKSTTIKMLTGILLPTSGTVSVLGRDPYRERVENAKNIGVVFGQRTQLWWDLAFIESLNLVARIYEVPQTRYRQLLEQFTDTLELKEILHVPIRNMSLGQKMRAELAATLIHEPQVVYLDEPTIGLDLIVKERIRNFIKEQNQLKNTTVILTTHDLGDIEELCSRVIIIDSGKLIYDGPISKIKERFGKYREITFELKQSTKSIDLIEGSEVIASEPGYLTVRFDRSICTASQVASSLMSQVEVNDFSLSEPDLASVVKQIYNGALHEGSIPIS
ncbi:MAG: sugar ABC transporter ATP-binding protein [Anaerolinea sp.]|nr:sugar ABC transporter ATP-binding protein [Anaerolinea sp.]